jgi:type II secretory pathway component PulC
MRLFEFDETSGTSDANLITALELLRNRYKDSGKPAIIGTQSLINMVLNTDKNFSYSSLVSANENPAVKNIIKSFNREKVILNTTDDEAEVTDATTTNPRDVDTSNPATFQQPVDDVSSMAKRAAKDRGAPLA